MPTGVQLHDVVALTEDIEATHLLTHQPLRLRRGQIGTAVMPLNADHFQVEFADPDGRAYAMLPVSANHLMVLREEPEALPA